MRPNAARMQAVVAFVTAHPGLTMAAATAHLLEGEQRTKPSVYKQAASVVERVIRDRLVRQDQNLRLHPWNPKWKAYAEALERAAFAAPNEARYSSTMALAIEAWRDAGDANRAQMLTRLSAERRASESAAP